MLIETKIVNQIGALPFAICDDQVLVLLITSRTRGRWIVPKGKPMSKRLDAEVAGIEALEEAGVVGPVHENAIGSYDYLHLNDDGSHRPSRVTLYALLAIEHRLEWKEKAERTAAWRPLDEAAHDVDDAGLGQLLLGLHADNASTLREIAANLHR
jgi:8-oxo-dGTP pyrophosphatase MutT (NUDIX family)